MDAIKNNSPGRKSPLTREQVDQLKSLIDEREHLLLAKMREIVQSLPNVPASKVGGNGGAWPADAQPEDGLTAISRDVEEYLAIKIAGDAIRDNSYGICTICQGDIGFRRLLVLPTAQRCLPCQEDAERTDWRSPQDAH